MSAKELRVHRHIKASADQVWSVLTDIEHAAETLRGVTDIEILEGAEYDVGTRWVETRRMFGKAESQTLEVTESKAPVRTTIEARSRGVDYRTVFTLEDRDGGTELTMIFGASHPDPTLLNRLTTTIFGHVGAVVTKRLLVQDLEDIARAAERDSGTDSN